MEYIRSCDELWQKGMYFELNAYQHHVFMDWRFVDDERWVTIHTALNGAGVESMQARWDEIFGVKEEVIDEVKVKKPRKKTVSKKISPLKKTESKIKVSRKNIATKMKSITSITTVKKQVVKDTKKSATK